MCANISCGKAQLSSLLGSDAEANAAAAAAATDDAAVAEVVRGAASKETPRRTRVPSFANGAANGMRT